jgi:hypothetical protein
MSISFRGTTLSAGLSTLLAVSASTSPVAAQSTAPQPSTSSAVPPAPTEPTSNEPSHGSHTDDAVVLKTGAVYRGIIFELVPGNHVAILLPTGDSKQFAMSDVRYAGAASEMPKEGAIQTLPPEPKPPPAAPSLGEHVVRLVAGQPDVTFWVERRTQHKSRPGGFSRLCTAPCEVSLPSGRYRFALAQSGDAPRTAGGLVTITGDTTVRGDIVSRAERRTGGWVIAGIGGAGGLVMLLAAPNASKRENRDLLTGFGIGSIVMGTVFGLPLGLSSDVVVAKSIPEGDVGVRDHPGARLSEGTDAAKGIWWTTTF